MKFTYGWLGEHLDTDLDAAGIAARLTAIGLEVEGVENAGEKLADFRVAEVVEAGPHPNADKLQLLSVDAGPDINGGKRWQVVCGAPNARAGMKGVFAPPGTYVPGAGFTLKPAKIRDVESFGMMCSTRELELGEEHDGIIELPADAPVGTAFPDYAGLNDPVFDVSITPNRQDCMGVRGIARDLAAAGAGKLKSLAEAYAPAGLRAPADGAAGEIAPIDGSGPGPDVRTDDPEGCPAFYARSVSGVTNKEAPEWMRRRLVAIGQKPISALVDITNFIMIDLGRPLHVYDAAKLSGGLVARKAKPGEEVLALNGKSYTLDARMTVIADASHVHDIGGIMGGEDSGVSESTTDVVIECAYFTPESIAVTGQALGLTSDARQRFERGVDPAFLDDGLTIATQLVMAICGGSASEATRAGSPPNATRTIAFDPAHTLSLAGIDVPAARQADILRSLGFAAEGTDILTVSVPSWRRDVSGSADLVEEVVRIVGLDAVPSTPLPRMPGVAKPTATKMQLLERKARRAAAAFGLDEAVNWSFISEAEAAPFGGGDWILANPISEEMKVMRPSLLPGLLAAAQRNGARGADSVRSFEVGRRYFVGKDNASDERLTLGLLLAGERGPRDWQAGKAGAPSPYDAKAAVEAILAAVGAPVANLQVMPVDGEGGSAIWHPGQSATLRLGPKTVLAEFGSLHPRLVKAFGLTGGVVAAQIFLDAIPQGRASTPMRAAYAPPALQVVRRDFAFLVDDNVAASDLVRAVRGADKVHIVDARLFDRFAGDGVPDDKVSLAVEVTLQPGDKSFTDDEIKAISDKVVAAAGKQGAELRG
ncbi:phenylalanine--tRNA ligase subunit beta [Sphingorhabdus soli]|uniref:Phenylalanine--tRNA ligase beta subunit n=1 Tax=Flavisphingopyxis soli TaxID=2601267 RepID=A0A5C6UMM7_9SPHN|nr:phenylalanine--tRNA ligase subunit beta [Sphingorhabdus soli]TXC73356.1 phenylalanine--tRNA ligase subunit beta [Sphingorhabdus soli]